MFYKNHNIKQGIWQVNPEPLSRFIIFEISQDEKMTKFIFNHNAIGDMAQNSNEGKLEIEAIEEIKKFVDNDIVFQESLYFYELYPGNFVRFPIPPEWYLTKYS